jgi:hypothetical protein
LEGIKQNGLAATIKEKEERLQILYDLLGNYDEGRSKSFYCLSAALLPVNELKKAVAEMGNLLKESDEKKRAALVRETFIEIASRNNMDLLYRKKI